MAKSMRIVSKDIEGVEKIVVVKKPGHKELTEAQFYSAKIFNKARDAGACLRSKLNEFLIKEGVWSEDNQKLVETLTADMSEKLELLRTGKHPDGKKVKLTEGRELAIQIRNIRNKVNNLLSKLREHDSYTLEGQAENARFDALVSTCCFDEDGNRVFLSVDDYYDKKDEPYAEEAASKIASMVFGLDDKWENKLPENEFLLKFKFVDNNLRYINRDGKFVDSNGQLVDEEGNLIDEAGNKIQVESTPEPEFENDVDI